MRGWQRLWPVGVLLLALGGAYALGVQHALSFAALGERQAALRGALAARPMLGAMAYLGCYVLVAALCLPGAVMVTLAGGLLFGTWWGGGLAVLGATAGATLLFLVARYALGGWLAARAGGMLERIRPGLERDGFSYLLALRLVPLVPFWLVNLVPALVGVRLGTFVAATALGIVPGTFVFASVGAGLGSVLAAGKTPDPSLAAQPEVVLPLLGLAVLSLLPVGWRRWRARHG